MFLDNELNVPSYVNVSVCLWQRPTMAYLAVLEYMDAHVLGQVFPVFGASQFDCCDVARVIIMPTRFGHMTD